MESVKGLYHGFDALVQRMGKEWTLLRKAPFRTQEEAWSYIKDNHSADIMCSVSYTLREVWTNREPESYSSEQDDLL